MNITFAFAAGSIHQYWHVFPALVTYSVTSCLDLLVLRIFLCKSPKAIKPVQKKIMMLNNRGLYGTLHKLTWRWACPIASHTKFYQQNNWSERLEAPVYISCLMFLNIFSITPEGSIGIFSFADMVIFEVSFSASKSFIVCFFPIILAFHFPFSTNLKVAIWIWYSVQFLLLHKEYKRNILCGFLYRPQSPPTYSITLNSSMFSNWITCYGTSFQNSLEWTKLTCQDQVMYLETVGSLCAWVTSSKWLGWKVNDWPKGIGAFCFPSTPLPVGTLGVKGKQNTLFLFISIGPSH